MNEASEFQNERKMLKNVFDNWKYIAKTMVSYFMN